MWPTPALARSSRLGRTCADTRPSVQLSDSIRAIVGQLRGPPASLGVTCRDAWRAILWVTLGHFAHLCRNRPPQGRHRYSTRADHRLSVARQGRRAEARSARHAPRRETASDASSGRVEHRTFGRKVGRPPPQLCARGLAFAAEFLAVAGGGRPQGPKLNSATERETPESRAAQPKPRTAPTALLDVSWGSRPPDRPPWIDSGSRSARPRTGPGSTQNPPFIGPESAPHTPHVRHTGPPMSPPHQPRIGPKSTQV